MENLNFMGYTLDLAVLMDWGSKILFAILIYFATKIIASACKWAFAKLINRIEFLQRDTGSGSSIGESLGTIVGLLVWLLGWIAILNVFQLNEVTGPLKELLDTVMGFIPNIVGAGIIFFIGMIVARIVRDLVTTFLQTVNLDKWFTRAGGDEVTGNSAITSTLANIVYVLIIVPVSIAALQALKISSISDPAVTVLEMILGAIPLIIGAALVLGIAYLIARWVSGVLEDLLPGLGVDRSVGALGILPEGTSVSGIVSKIVMVAIMLFAAIAATRLLNFPELTAILDNILELGGRVLFGGLVIAVGFFIANLLASFMGAQNPLAASVVRYAALILFAFMGLQFMGVGNEIVQTAFTALVATIGVAAAIAFGMGGRDAAARQLEKMQGDPAPKKTTRRAPAKKAASED
ncbi:mechanosensitive ion channel [Alterisphingorhabdus coralli]|uniref:Small-conductance mechanosensitive channel n=1 Tax=Alterisphingorhabdus coralli TaxID=3071408 RepID=A0AA97F8G2_9SPHN|nr:mechanosensitive ion channel [Parasphingorhabdus sp. SCSIO 66989]WOE76076.1 mechanosensitive ion channel [Parasphingorhabdus sp. SCSIO 66989]